MPPIKGIDYIGVAVVYFCHDGKGNFLMHQRSKNARDEHGLWDIGAGGLDFGNTIEGTLRQEIKEEYGTDILEFEFLGYRNVFRQHNNKPTHWVTYDFKVLVDPQMVKNGEPHKFDQVGWFTRQTMPTQTMSELPRFLKPYQDRLFANV